MHMYVNTMCSVLYAICGWCECAHGLVCSLCVVYMYMYQCIVYWYDICQTYVLIIVTCLANAYTGRKREREREREREGGGGERERRRGKVTLITGGKEKETDTYLFLISRAQGCCGYY